MLAESDLDEYIPELTPRGLRTYHLDQQINDRGVPIDIESVKNAAFLRDEYKRRLVNKCESLIGLRPSQTDKLGTWVREEQGYDIENLQKATVTNALKDPDCPPDVRKCWVFIAPTT